MTTRFPTFFSRFSDKQPAVIGMIHLLPLPGTPAYGHHRNQNGKYVIIDRAIQETLILYKAGVDALLIENMHDLPYLKGESVGHEITAMMSVAAYEIKKQLPPAFPVGVQVLAGANIQALAVAKAAGLDFIRVEGFVFAHIADEGFTGACAGELLRYRKQIDAEHIAIFTDIKKNTPPMPLQMI